MKFTPALAVTLLTRSKRNRVCGHLRVFSQNIYSRKSLKEFTVQGLFSKLQLYSFSNLLPMSHCEKPNY